MACPAAKSAFVLLGSLLTHKAPVLGQQKDLKMFKEAEKTACQSTRNADLTFSSYWLLLPPMYNTSQ